MATTVEGFCRRMCVSRFLMVGGCSLVRSTLRHPARLVPLAFLFAIAVGTVLLMLPISRAGDGSAPPLTALFTSTSAVCVTGLIVEDTPVYWSRFGQAVIVGLFQVGGFGIMSGATLLGLLVTQRIRLRDRLVAQMETKTLGLGNVASVLRLVLLATVTVEMALTAILTLQFRFAYDESWGRAVWHGLFHAVSAFNNAGFSTYSDNLYGFRGRSVDRDTDHGGDRVGRARLPCALRTAT
jgi:trk system potassium uptake protein